MHPIAFIQDLTVIMVVASLTTIVCHWLKQPVVLGYIIAGIFIGPSTPNILLFIRDKEIINTFAELGIIFLMFALGLEFNLRRLFQVCRTALVTALAEIIVMISIGYLLGKSFGWPGHDSLFLGALLSISSTTIIVKALHELNIKNHLSSQLIFGTLIVEDIFAIIILALLSGVAMTGSLSMLDVFVTLSKLTLFLTVSIALGLLLVPRLLAYVAKFNSHEMLLITTLGLCFGFCLIVALLNYSVALGAFLIGAIIAESKQLETIELLTVPLRDMFSAIFFVSVGLMFDINIVAPYYGSILLITLAVILGKSIACSFGVLITGHNAKTAMRVGMGMSQIGEFSFIIAALGISLHVTSDFLYPIAVAVSAITTLTTPYLIKYSDNLVGFIMPRHKQ